MTVFAIKPLHVYRVREDHRGDAGPPRIHHDRLDDRNIRRRLDRP
jgi:hypothetical protein